MEAPRVVSLHRYPVKSMLGEPMQSLDIDHRGCAGDRWWSVRTPEDKIGSGKSSRRFAAVPGLLDLRARHDGGRVVVTFPDGSQCATDDPGADDRLSAVLGRELRFARETAVSHYDDGPVSLIGRASVDALSRDRGVPVDPARFRANLLIDTDEPFAEERWVGREITVGTAVLAVSMVSPRCVMVDMKTADLPAQPGNLKAVTSLNEMCLGVIAAVVRPGVVSRGVELTVR